MKTLWPWENLVTGVPFTALPWSWTVSGEPGPYARIRVKDSSDASVFGLSDVFAVGRNMDWLQPEMLTGQVPSSQTLDLAITMDQFAALAQSGVGTRRWLRCFHR